MKHVVFAVAAMALCLAASAAQDGKNEHAAPDAEGGNYVPAMGDIMPATQMRHIKLWFAGKAGNWDLAAYELGELKEGLDDVAKFHPVFDGAHLDVLLKKLTVQPLADLDTSIKNKNRAAFEKSFDQMTRACNGCHHAASRGFIVIRRPTALPYSNQEFSPKKK